MIITVGRQHGSNGHDIARLLAEELNMKCYDKEIVDEAAANSQFSKEIFDSYDEKRVSAYVIPTPHYVGMNEGFRLNMQVAAAQFDAMRNLADKGNCIFVGRCADYVLGECANVLNVVSVFIRADLEKRVRRAMRVYSLEEGEARRLIQKTDKIRAKYYTAHTQRDWGAIGNYTLIVDTGKLGTDGAAALIETAVKALNERETQEL